MEIVFVGTGLIGIPALEALVKSGLHPVRAVFTAPDRPAGRRLRLRASPVKVAATALGLPIVQPEKIRAPAAVAEIRRLAPDVLIVASYGQILSREVLEIPRHGCLNIHASLLPRHRGASPIQAAILAGDRETGVTIMRMDEGLDTGDMLVSVSTPIGAAETAGALEERLARLAPEPLLDALSQIQTGTYRPIPQDERLATYAPKLVRAEGEINWSQSAEEIERRVRAMNPWPGAFSALPDKTLLKIHRASVLTYPSSDPGTVLGTSAGGMIVAAGWGAVELREVQVAGGIRLPAAEFLRGHPLPVGTKLG